MDRAEVIAERQRVFDRFEMEIFERQRTNSTSFDKYVLTLSSSGLAISLAALANDASGSCVIALISSWIFFFLTITASLTGFLVSNKALDFELETAKKYYLELDDAAYGRKNWLSVINSYLNYVAGLFFLIAVLLLVVYSMSRVF